jgi:hypothetical protein
MSYINHEQEVSKEHNRSLTYFPDPGGPLIVLIFMQEGGLKIKRGAPWIVESAPTMRLQARKKEKKIALKSYLQ